MCIRVATFPCCVFSVGLGHFTSLSFPYCRILRFLRCLIHAYNLFRCSWSRFFEYFFLLHCSSQFSCLLRCPFTRLLLSLVGLYSMFWTWTMIGVGRNVENRLKLYLINRFGRVNPYFEKSRRFIAGQFWDNKFFKNRSRIVLQQRIQMLQVVVHVLLGIQRLGAFSN